jgi:hypothetical protein
MAARKEDRWLSTGENGESEWRLGNQKRRNDASGAGEGSTQGMGDGWLGRRIAGCRPVKMGNRNGHKWME